MFGLLNKTRKPYNSSPAKQVMTTLAMLLFGAAMGVIVGLLDKLPEAYIPVFLQWLEPKAIFSRFAVWIFIAVCVAVFSKSPVKAGVNVFAFFVGMLGAYCVWTKIFRGIIPSISDLAPWFILTVVSAVTAFLCWYGRGRGALAVGISSVLIAIFCAFAFNLTVSGFGVQHFFELLLWLACIGILFRTVRQSIYSFLISVPVALALEYTGLLGFIGIG